MIVQTSRFGPLEMNEDRFITFERGILGFPDTTEYALVQSNEESGFYWLQAVDQPDLAFVVCDPRLFVTDYRAPVKAEDLAPLGLEDPADAQVFVIVNKVEGMLTGNLQGPLVINVRSRLGRQLVLSDKRYSTRHPLMRVPERQAMSRTG